MIVTATKRAESLQDIPVAVNAFNSETIQEAGINNAGDLAIMTPALNINVNQSPFNARMTIRGIGTAQTDPALEPSVGLFVDGVFLGRSGLGMSDLTDIERIEVLQGPQGTLYGKNTNAGAISVITKRPNFEEFEGYVEASAGDYSMYRLTASASGPCRTPWPTGCPAMCTSAMATTTTARAMTSTTRMTGIYRASCSGNPRIH